MAKTLYIAVLAAALISTSFNQALGQVILAADGVNSNTYSLINSVLGGTAYEVPDCNHSSYGPHITQIDDPQQVLLRPVFAFHIHVDPDNDRCITFDRQRNEIKTYNPSPNYLKGFLGETVKYSWNFMLPSGFQASPSFTHIHQIKAVDGDDSLPIFTLTPRHRRGQEQQLLELIYTGRDQQARVIESVDLAPFLGNWVHVVEIIKYGEGVEGTFSLKIFGIVENQLLMEYESEGMDTWRDGISYNRPKWGIYRSLNDREYLRDEVVLFDTFCLAKDNHDCL